MSDIHIGLRECEIEYNDGREAAGIEVVFRDELKTEIDAYFRFKLYSEIRQVNGETIWDDLKKISAGLKLAVQNYFEID